MTLQEENPNAVWEAFRDDDGNVYFYNKSDFLSPHSPSLSFRAFPPSLAQFPVHASFSPIFLRLSLFFSTSLLALTFCSFQSDEQHTMG
eukprot:747950-Hanusia_phi.AAC.5